jgi:hypothetical protein
MRFLTIALFGTLSTAIVGCSGGAGGGSALPSQVGARVASASIRTAANLTVTPYASLVLSGAPIAYYPLSDSASTMTDSGINALNGVYGANVKHGGAALTSAESASVTLPGSPAGSDIPSNTGTVAGNALLSTPSSALTIEAWIKPADYNRTNSFPSIASYGKESSGSAWALQITPQSGVDLFLKVSGGAAASYELTAGALVPTQIYHVVATFDGASAKLYLNGSLARSIPASGKLNYSSVSAQYGLAIGGELGSSRPIFNGDVNDVAIYATALSPANILAHYVTGQIVQPTVETPASSDAFVDSIGVVTHIGTTTSAYYNSWPTFYNLITASGIRHIRDGLATTPTWYPQRVNQLATVGIRASLVTSLTETSQGILAKLPIFATSVEAVEGANEPDLSGDPNWVQNARNLQQVLWSTVKNNSATLNLRVIGPAVTSIGAETSLGDLSAYMDSSDIHDYMSGYNPGTAGWGSLGQYGVYGSLTWGMNIAAIVGGAKPVTSTETGYSSSLTDSGGVDSRTLARYIPRTYLEHFLYGIKHTTLYEFYDEPGNGTFGNFGLVAVNQTPKSSYFAIQSLINSLADPGTTFSTQPLSYVLTGNMNNVKHLLLQKRDGTYQLVIWLETASFDPNAKIDLAVAPQIVTLRPTSVPALASVSTIGDSGALTTTSLPFPSGVATISVDDRVTIVSFK